MESKINILEKSSKDLRIKIISRAGSYHAAILDPDENILGGMSKISNKEFGLSNANGVTILRSTEISKFGGHEYQIKDKEGNSIGVGSQKGFFHVNFSMKKEGFVSLHTEKSKNHLEIKSKSGKIVGQIESGSKDKEKFFNLQIIDLDFDRLELLGFFLFAYHNRFRWLDNSKDEGHYHHDGY